MLRTGALVSICLSLFLAAVAAHAAEKPVILHVDSYHEGYAWSQGIQRGVSAAAGNRADLRVHYMNTLAALTEEARKQAGDEAWRVVRETSPDAVIASDDEAAAYLVAPHHKDTALPFVFCGINWTAAAYGFPADNVTGMLEMARVDRLLVLLRNHADGERVGFLAWDEMSARKEAQHIKNIFGVDMVTRYAADVDQWKEAFAALQEQVDVLVLDSLAGEGAGSPELVRFAEEATRIPTGSCYEHMAPYVMITLAKVPEELGFWAGNAAFSAATGTPVSEIPMEYNKEGALVVNARIASRIGAVIPYKILEEARRVIE